MYIPFFRTTETARMPERSNPSDAGMDVFNAGTRFTLDPGDNVLIPTGLKAGIPHGYALMVCNRSGMGAKRSLVVGAHVIDAGYDGDIFIDLHNIGTETQCIESGDKIAQLLLIPVSAAMPLEAENQESLYGDYEKVISKRGSGGFGSTGK